jgi:hypothetical protein
MLRDYPGLRNATEGLRRVARMLGVGLWHLLSLVENGDHEKISVSKPAS